MQNKLSLWPKYVFSLALLVSSGQIFWSSAQTLPVQTLTDAMLADEKLDSQQLTDIASHMRSAISVRDTGDTESMLGLALLLRDNGSSSETLIDAAAATERSLSLSPANPYAWARLSLIDQLRQAPASEILAHWRLSILTGQHEPKLYPVRIAVGLQLMSELPVDDRQLLLHQIVAAWHANPQVVLDSVADQVTLNFVRAALASDLSSLIEFEKKRSTLKSQ